MQHGVDFFGFQKVDAKWHIGLISEHSKIWKKQKYSISFMKTGFLGVKFSPVLSNKFKQESSICMPIKLERSCKNGSLHMNPYAK